MSVLCGPVPSGGVLVDTYTARVFPIQAALLLSSSPELENVESSVDMSQDLPLFLRPVTPSDSYSVRVKVHHEGEGCAAVRVVEGVCSVNGVLCDPGEATQQLRNGSFLVLGSSYRLQYKTSSVNKPHPLRILPPTPGGQGSATPTFHSYTPPIYNENNGFTSECSEMATRTTALTSGSFSGSVDCGGMNDGLRSRLKRIAKEVTARGHGYTDRKPPPPYEQVANSINYQLLHHTHPRVTTKLIDSLYSTLKEMELKDLNLLDVYSSFLASYLTSRGQSATPTCMMPADLPVLGFVLDMLMHICCMPDMTPLVEKICPLWVDILSILSTSRPNQDELVKVGGASRILSCMHLSVMSECVLLQERGWVVLGSIVDSPTHPGRKPVILDASLSLVLSLVAKQLLVHHSHLPLVTALIYTLARLATVANEAVACEITTLPEGESSYSTYTPLQGAQVLQLLKEGNVLDHMMRVPPHLRTHPHFQDNYCALVKALHPIRLRKVVCREATPPKTTPTKPPPKPARAHKTRRATIRTGQGLFCEVAKTADGHIISADSASNKLRRRPHSYSMALIGSSDHVTHPLLLSDDQECTKQENSHFISSPVFSEDNVASLITGDVNIGDSNHDNDVANTVVCMTKSEQKQLLKNQDHIISEDLTPEASSPSHVTPPTDHMTLPTDHVTPPTDHMTSPTDHVTSLTDHVTPTDFVTPPTDHMTSPTDHVTSLTDHVTPPIDHVTHTPAELIPLTEILNFDNHPPSNDFVTTFDQSDDAANSLPTSESLSRDVQSLLDSLRAPLPADSGRVRGRGRQNSVYFRASVKRRSRKGTYVVRPLIEGGDSVRPLIEGGDSVRERPLIEGGDSVRETDLARVQGSSRMQWGEATPTSLFLSADSVSLFEVSGEVLSESHTLLEEVVSGHSDITTTLGERVELLEGVLLLWKHDKGLQAATNTLQGCFSDEDSDLPLFMDALNCFLLYKSPWTLAVCCVLLPALKEVISTQRDSSCVLTVVAVVLSVVDRFSDLILACKGRSRGRKLSQATDRQQQVLCYQQLYAIRVVIGNRLDMDSDLKEVSSQLRKLHSALKPFKNELNDS